MAAFARAAARRAPPRVFHLWPEHGAALWLWLELQTQWREGFAGATGLDYAGVEAYLRSAVPRAQRSERFAEVRVMERAWLAARAKARS